MDPKQISSLWKLLRNEGDKVLNSDYKLTFSGPLLRALNDSFKLIADQGESSAPQSFQVVKPNNSKSEVFPQLQYIYDLVQKTAALCITFFPGDKYFQGAIDISIFRALRKLEINKVTIKQVTGIQRLRAQLAEIVCMRCIKRIEDILVECGGDNSNGFAWNELREANFSFNGLKTIDSSLEFAQYLQTLNLSHNQITSVEAIKWLPHLKFLDLSYNRLVHVPDFHVEARKRLTVLILNNNFIEELNEVSHLDSLIQLDMAQNYILDHLCLQALSGLECLYYLDLTDNPLYYNWKHRQITAGYLNERASQIKFILDKEELSRYERSLVGTTKPKRSALSRPSSSQSIASRTTQNSPTTSGKIGRIDTSSEIMTSSLTKQKKLKPRTIEFEDKVEEPEVEVKIVKQNSPVIEVAKEHLETKKQIEFLRKEHGPYWLQGKNVHAVKTVLGISASPSTDIKYLTSQQTLDDFLTETSSDISSVNAEEVDKNVASTLTSTPIDPSKLPKFAEGTPTSSIHSPETVYHSADNTNDNNETSYLSCATDADTLVNTTSRDLNTIFSSMKYEPEVSDPEDNETVYIVSRDDLVDEDRLLLVSDISIREKDFRTGRTLTKWGLKTLESCEIIKEDTLRLHFDTVKKDKKERVFVVKGGLCQQLQTFLRQILSERSLFEMNQTLYKCVKCSVQFSRENTQKRNNLDLPCPHCNSLFIIEIKESPRTLTNTTEWGKELFERSTDVPTKVSTSAAAGSQITTQPQSSGDKLNVIEKSSSHSSIDMYEASTNTNYLLLANVTKGAWRSSTNKNLSSAGSLNGSSCSKASNSQTSFDSNQSVAGSSAQDREKDFDLNQRYAESDIEILSNPSQSSIEVLDPIHSSRKPSEERRIYHVPSLETIEDNSLPIVSTTLLTTSKSEVTQSTLQTDNNVVKTEANSATVKKNLFTNLTESSSSGSVTDSICTAYENTEKAPDKTVDAGETAEGSTIADTKAELIASESSENKTIEKTTKNDVSLISSVLGGLFQSTNSLLSRSQKTDESSAVKNEIFEFSFKDYSFADQKLKFYLYHTLFQDKDEFFKWLVKGKIVSNEKGGCFDCIIVMSSTKFYILKIIGEQNVDVNKWLKRHTAVNVDQLQSIQVLPSKIGFTVNLKNTGKYHLLLQDGQRTENLWLFFANNPLPAECVLENNPLDMFSDKIKQVTEGVTSLLSMLSSCEVISEEVKTSHLSSSFITTDSHLYLTSSPFEWLLEDVNVNIETFHTQLMSNLVEIDRPAKNIFEINFVDECNDKSELWKCTFPTEDSANQSFHAIGQSWEALFRMPLESK